MPAPDLSSFKVATAEVSSATKFNNLVQAVQDELADIDPDQIPGYPSDLTKFLRGDGVWAIADPYTSVVKAADESVTSSTALQNDDHLSFPASAAVTYEIQMTLIYSNAAGGGPGFKMAFGEDSTNTRGSVNLVLSIADTPGVSQILTDQTTTIIAGTNAINRLVSISGYHTGNGGTFRLLWAQGVSNGTATILKAKSFLRYRAVA